jgi:2-octaprenyl-6-methoxyphenol hydroxylase
MEQSKITIVGAGVAGLATASILSSLPVSITVIERSKIDIKQPKINARTAALMTGSLAILNRAGIMPEIMQCGAPLRTMKIIDDSNFPRGAVDDCVEQTFHAMEINQDYFGYNMPIDMLKHYLFNKIKGIKNISILDGYDLNENTTPLDDANLIIGADGRHSFVRDFAGISIETRNYNQTAITCMIKHSHNHVSTEFHRNGGPCTFVPMGNHHSTVVWIEKTDDANEFIKLAKQDFVNALQARTRDVLGEIELVVPPEAWPLSVLKANQLIGNKTLLMAEAAHAFSPIGAQGLNLSLRDVDAVYDVVKQALLLGQDIGDYNILKEYERKRMPDIHTRYNAVNGLNDMVQNDFFNPARRFGLKLLSLSPLREFLMEKGLGR